jgi:RNA polymerase sigma-70 factor (ECF subfamily)
LETSERLVQRAQAKDAEAFAALIAQYERTALALAYSVTGNATVAADVVQDAFLRAWQRIGDLEDASRFGGWFCRIVRNLAIDAIRRGPRAAEPLEDNLALPAIPKDSDPESDMHRRETSHRIGQALDVLDELTRSAVVLRYYEVLSSKQIGELLELSPAAVDMRLSRARVQLRDILSDDAGDSLTGAGGAMEYGAV